MVAIKIKLTNQKSIQHSHVKWENSIVRISILTEKKKHAVLSIPMFSATNINQVYI